MKWVKCVYNGSYHDITEGKIYEVLSIDNLISITIINDLGVKEYFSMIGIKGTVWFEDVTAEIRDNKINKILNEMC